MPQEPAANFTRVINLDEHNGKEIKRAILPRTAGKYHRSLMIFDRFLELHPAACSPPDIKTYKGFLEFYYIISDLKTKLGLPDVEMPRDGLSLNDLTILLTQLWFRDFKEYRSQYPDQSRVQLTAPILLYCFSSAQTGEVHESTAHRSIAQQKDNGDDNDTKLWASVMVAYYKSWSMAFQCTDSFVAPPPFAFSV
ncbi:predicted protein [Aspergillus nidulans FGSC A4]|uniref:Uncharacterized protein n=1 Tax=Emericella nidulans (strain FGSC A4 / ATCC 38163 / CBS 112.46 / NRRL 194 / M139) TaxID=227321 RepID=Q5B8C8_EMENI|nr:hypothetical protein [Aspergillus nidulans FGSC A4]EAA62927.1 predicted protein [Aspergillus nidulans FGSC A4]CBF83199.1 TPA: conserved hypothetical protein [Aspergillus nidulans FGSC A4]|eukprot:XP_660806.1 predicted protein [Aspergillus nidulans FGSC A4]